jgi:CelD/BcsL family acetyltransferase involved in cellulose biosynthesis
MHVKTIDPITDPSWNELIERSPEATAFHSPAWAAVLRDTYGFRPECLVAFEEDTPVAGIPLFKVGNRLVGAPFSDFCPPLSLQDQAGADLLSAAKERAGRNGSSALEIRGDAALDLGEASLHRGDTFIRHVIPLHLGMEEIERRLHDSARRAVRKARKEGIGVRLATSVEDMRDFYRLNVLTRKKHGLIPQPWSFFKNIQRHHMEGGSGWLLLAEHEGQTIAGDLLLACKDKLVYKFNASDPRFLGLRPNNLLLYSAIEFGVERGFREFDLGRCEEDADGLRRFKLLWGSEEIPLNYYYYPSKVTGGSRITGNPLARRMLPVFVRYAPPWALAWAGSLLYKRFA